MKRLLSAVFALVFIFTACISVIPTVGAAAKEIKFSLTNASGIQDGEFTVDLVVEENPGVWAFLIGIYFDKDTFILRDMKMTDEFKAVGSIEGGADNLDSAKVLEDSDERYPAYRIINAYAGYGVKADDVYTKILLFEAKGYNNVTLTGKVATLTFQVQGVAKDGEYTIGISPDIDGGIINADAQDVPVKWSNAYVAVGSGKQPPVETAPTVTPEDTVDASEITTSGDTNIPDYLTSDVTDTDTKKPVETTVGEDGKVYVKQENGETVEYDPEIHGVTGDTVDGTTDETTVPDIDVDKTEEIKQEEKKNQTLLYIIIAVAAALAVAAVVLVVFINKAKKETEQNESDK